MKFLGAIALLGAVGLARGEKEEEKVELSMNMLFPKNWEPEGIAASVVKVEKSATVFAFGCPTKAADDCSVYIKTMTEGPSTWIYGGAWDNIAGVDQYTMKNRCKVNTEDDDMTCTMAVTQVKDDTTLSTSMTSTTSGLGSYMHPVTITAGGSKLSLDLPEPTTTSKSTSSESTTSESSTRKSSSSEHEETTSSTKTKTSHSHTTTSSSSTTLVPSPSSTADSTTLSSTITPTPSPPPPAVVTPVTPGNAATSPSFNGALICAAIIAGCVYLL